MRGFFSVIGFGLGLALGAGIIYGLLTSESARLLVMFLLGAILFGGVVLVTALMINRQWTRSIEGLRPLSPQVRIDAPPWPQMPPGQSWGPANLLPPPVSLNGSQPGWGSEDDEVVA